MRKIPNLQMKAIKINVLLYFFPQWSRDRCLSNQYPYFVPIATVLSCQAVVITLTNKTRHFKRTEYKYNKHTHMRFQVLRIFSACVFVLFVIVGFVMLYFVCI